MRLYVLTKGAAADIREIARYTVEQWGELQDGMLSDTFSTKCHRHLPLPLRRGMPAKAGTQHQPRDLRGQRFAAQFLG